MTTCTNIVTHCSRRVLNAALIGSLVLFSMGRVQAQSVGKISGVVTGMEAGGEQLVGCHVSIVGTRMGASTGPDGTYFILNVPPGVYDLQASMVGYQSVLKRGAVVNAGRTTSIDFSLPTKDVAVQEVVVEVTRPDVEREKTSTSAIIRSDEVQTVAGMRNVGDILNLAADVNDGHFRGGRTGEEYYVLQGMGITNPLDNSTAFLPIMSAVEEVEVITSGFGAQYGNAQSGVVNISMKEGKSDMWRTRVETRMRAPDRKHFGPSVFDPNANPYLAQLLNSNTLWKNGDPESSNSTPYYTTYFPIANYRTDTVVQLQVARALWQLQQHRDLYRNYGNQVDYSAEVATGGPIDDRMRMFTALRSNISWPTFPTEQPDIQRQVMGNLAIDAGSASTLRISGGYDMQNTNVFPSSSSYGYYSWLWDRILSIDYQQTSNLQLGARFTHAVNAKTFYELKVNSIWTKTKVGSTPSPSFIPDDLVNNQADQIDWDKVIPQVVQGPDKFYYLRGDDTFRNDLTRTIASEVSITSQVTPSHLLNAGVQFTTYLLDVADSLTVRTGTGGPIQNYRVKPFEGALYAQDKMEFEGMIANVGLRWDMWSSNHNYYTSLFDPFLVTDAVGTPSYTAAAPQAKSPIIGRLQPRVGVSFPVSVNTVFHLNYGSFMQRPSFQYVVSSQVLQGTGHSNPVVLGNPRLEPEVTNSYDIGVTQGLFEGFTLDVSGYYKDVKNLIDQATFTSVSTNATYTTWFNRDYADIRGFRIALTKRKGAFTGSINYQFGVATGKSATTSSAPVTFTQDTSGAVATNSTKIPLRDILLNFDRTHNLILNLAYTTDEHWGPKVFGGLPLSGITISTNSFFRSGRPYTSPSNPTLINGARSPAEYNTDLRFTKRISNFFGVPASLYVEVLNLFDQKILNYDYVFGTPDAGSVNNVTAQYEKYGVDDPVNGIRYYADPTQTTRPNWAKVDQSFLIYDNQPRSFYFGLIIEL